MSFNVLYTENFRKEAKRLAKKYTSLKVHLLTIYDKSEKEDISDKELKMTSTDGHCLAQVRSEKYTLAEPKQWLMPRRAVFELKGF